MTQRCSYRHFPPRSGAVKPVFTRQIYWALVSDRMAGMRATKAAGRTPSNRGLAVAPLRLPAT